MKEVGDRAVERWPGDEARVSGEDEEEKGFEIGLAGEDGLEQFVKEGEGEDEGRGFGIGGERGGE